MAKQTTVTLTDDLDGSEAAVTVEYAWQGVPYEIDLNEKNASRFESAVAKYVAASRRIKPVKATTTSKKSRKTDSDGFTASEVRQWAVDHGHQVNPRGRIPTEIVEQYRSEVIAA